jgi:hypothetical protein
VETIGASFYNVFGKPILPSSRKDHSSFSTEERNSFGGDKDQNLNCVRGIVQKRRLEN